uniref:Uncharacterized protein n=1 Tax=Aliivibrio fischeri TaxID=668 RepID=H2ES67_ALIFS|nr:hypothetical protein [Aliivibrio fischeri]AEY78234.1 hypothetical protein [Aliivibrio fischeri]
MNKIDHITHIGQANLSIEHLKLNNVREELTSDIALYRQAIVNGEFHLLKELEQKIETKQYNFSELYNSIINAHSTF